jgi:hypothetical protein
VARLVRINSEERQNPTVDASNHFTVNFGNSTQLMDINRIVLKQISIPNVQYNVRAALGLNPVGNVFSYDNGAPQSITVTPGNYSITQLMATINANAQAVADGLVLTLDPITSHVTFTSTTAISYSNQVGGNNMAYILGITADSAPAVLSFTAGGLPDLSVHPNIYIASAALSDGSNMVSPTLGSLPICAVIPITVPFGGIINYAPSQEHLDDIHFISYASGKSIQTVDLVVYDGDANLIDLQGLNWTFVVKAYQAPA